MSSALVVALLLAAPLQVRVLEKERASSARLEGTLTCDGKPLASGVEVSAGVRELKAGEQTCTEVVARAVTVKTRELTRTFPGVLHVTLEGSALRFIDEVDVEEYLPAVVEAEASGFPAAALEAQAVVSRTFALSQRRRHSKDGYDLCDLAHCQVFHGTDSSEAARAAVKKTKDLVELAGGVALRPVYFHGACGGHTSSAQDVFGEPGSLGVSDVVDGAPACKAAPDFDWSAEFERTKLVEAFNGREDVAFVEVLRRDGAGRVIELKLFGRRMSAEEFLSKFGRAFGWGVLHSAKFTVEEHEGQVRISGTGRGHGVGLCQAGAQALAKKGFDFRAILQRYFPDGRVAEAPR